MRAIIIGPPQSGKTTLFRKLIRHNGHINFSLTIDEITNIGAGVFPIDLNNNLPANFSFIITTTNIDYIPRYVRNVSILIYTPAIRHP